MPDYQTPLEAYNRGKEMASLGYSGAGGQFHVAFHDGQKQGKLEWEQKQRILADRKKDLFKPLDIKYRLTF